MANEFADKARRAKATKLADTLAGSNLGSEAAKTITQEQWRALAAAIPVNSPSAETQALVVQLLRDRENAALRVSGFDQPGEAELWQDLNRRPERLDGSL